MKIDLDIWHIGVSIADDLPLDFTSILLALFYLDLPGIFSKPPEKVHLSGKNSPNTMA